MAARVPGPAQAMTRSAIGPAFFVFGHIIAAAEERRGAVLVTVRDPIALAR